MSTQAELPKGHPMRDAWEAYRATEKYANSRHWALDQNHVDGSLWAAFIAGYAAAPPAEAPADLVERIRKEVEFAVVDHCKGGDLWLATKLAADKIAKLAAAPAAPAPAIDRKSLMERAELLAACYRLKELVEGVTCHRWVNGSGLRLKDTSEWAAFYVAVNHMHDGGARLPASEAPRVTGGREDAQDAARYRWLRDGENGGHVSAGIVESERPQGAVGDNGWERVEWLYDDELDAAIDAALQAATGGAG